MDDDVDSYFLPGGILDSPSKDDLDHPPTHSLAGVVQLFPSGYGLRAPPSSTNVSRVLGGGGGGGSLASTATAPAGAGAGAAPLPDHRLAPGEETRYRRLSLEGTNPMAKEFTPAIPGSEVPGPNQHFFPLEGHFNDLEDGDNPLGSLPSPSEIESNLFSRPSLLASPRGAAPPPLVDVDLPRGGGLGMLSSPVFPHGTATGVQSGGLASEAAGLFPERSPGSRSKQMGVIGPQASSTTTTGKKASSQSTTSSASGLGGGSSSPIPAVSQAKSKGVQGSSAPNQQGQGLSSSSAGSGSTSRGPLLPTKTWPQSANTDTTTATLHQQAPSTSPTLLQSRAGPLEDISSPVLQSSSTGTGRVGRGGSSSANASSSVKKQQQQQQLETSQHQEKGGGHQQHRATSSSGSGNRTRENRAISGQNEGPPESGCRGSGSKPVQPPGGSQAGKERGGRRTRWAKVGTASEGGDEGGNDVPGSGGGVRLSGGEAITSPTDTTNRGQASTGKVPQGGKGGSVSARTAVVPGVAKKERGGRNAVGAGAVGVKQSQQQPHSSGVPSQAKGEGTGRNRTQAGKKEGGRHGGEGQVGVGKEKAVRKQRETGIVFARNSFSPILEGYGGSSGDEPELSDEAKSEGPDNQVAEGGAGSGGDSSESGNLSDASTVSSLTDETSSHNSKGDATTVVWAGTSAGPNQTTTNTKAAPQTSPTAPPLPAPADPSTLRPGKKGKEPRVTTAAVTSASPAPAPGPSIPAASPPEPPTPITTISPQASAPAPTTTAPLAIPAARGSEPPAPLVASSLPVPSPTSGASSPPSLRTSREAPPMTKGGHQRSKSKGGASSSGDITSPQTSAIPPSTKLPPQSIPQATLTPPQPSSPTTNARGVGGLGMREEQGPSTKLGWMPLAYKPLTFLLLRVRKAGVLSLVAMIMSWALDLAIAALGFLLAMLLAGLLIVLQLHRYALVELVSNYNLALCFAFPYGFKSIMALVGDWSPHWGSVLLWYSFLFQLFCTTGNKAHGRHASSPSSSSSSSSSSPLVLPAHMFRILLPLLLLAEGISRKSYLLDLSGPELLLLSFFLAALKMKRLTSPLFLLTWAIQVIAINYLNTSHPLGQYSQLIISLTALHGLSVIDVIASQQTPQDDESRLRGQSRLCHS